VLFPPPSVIANETPLLEMLVGLFCIKLETSWEGLIPLLACVFRACKLFDRDTLLKKYNIRFNGVGRPEYKGGITPELFDVEFATSDVHVIVLLVAPVLVRQKALCALS
jgi:hypothetical protein